MVEIIDKDIKIRNGNLIKVKNTDRNKFSNENREYYSCWVEDENGNNERCLLFTEKEINGFSNVSLNQKFIFGRLYGFEFGKRNGYIIKLNNKEEKLFFITKKIILCAENRANKNREDLTKKNYFIDLID